MTTTPLVSIVVPIVHDTGEINATLRSCTSQSLADIEVICVTVAHRSTADLEAFAASDPRVRVVHVADETAEPEAQRRGITEAQAAYSLIVAPGDELDKNASATCLQHAQEVNADIVEFGTVEIRAIGGSQSAGRPLSPRKRVMRSEDIVRTLFPEDVSVDKHMWRFMFRTDFLRALYSGIGASIVPNLRDDAPVVFLACATAEVYTAVKGVAYRRILNQDKTRDSVDPIEKFRHALQTIDSLNRIAPAVKMQARTSANPEPITDGFEFISYAAIGNALEILQRVPDEAHAELEAELRLFATELDIVVSAATVAPEVLERMVQRAERIELGHKPVRNVLLTTNILTTGGVSGVLRSQARMLLDAGYNVTIVTHRDGTDPALVPAGATLIQLRGSSVSARLLQWAEICRRAEIDVVVDHRTLYSRDWPGFALAAHACQVPTIGWIHSFALRPTYNSNELHTLLQKNLSALAQLVVLSPLDVAFWKLRGIKHTVYLPNPPSPLLLGSRGAVEPKLAPRDRPMRIIWWGRLEERTKRVTQLLDIAVALKRLGANFQMQVIGPDGDVKAARLAQLVANRGLEGLVDIAGPKHGKDLLDAIDASDIFVNTSMIEGYPLALAEAQSRGLPIVMYDLPWLALVQDNPAVIAVPQGDAHGLANAVLDLAAAPDRYEDLSRASIEASRRAASYDFTHLYSELLTGSLPPEFSPDPDLKDGQELLNLLIFYAENSAGSKDAGPAPKPRGRKSPQASARALAQAPSWGTRVERKLEPAGRYVIDRVPWLRPLARRVKKNLLLH